MLIICGKIESALTLQASLNGLSKRDASDGSDSGSDDSSDDSNSSSDSDSSSDESDDVIIDSDDVRDESTTAASSDDSVTTASSTDDCSNLRDYVESELPGIPALTPGGFSSAPSSVYVRVLNETAPTFLELLESTPSLFANISQVINNAFSRPDIAFNDIPALTAEFLAVANDPCGISLSPEQTTDVTRLFDTALTEFVLKSIDCGLLRPSAVEEGVAAADVNSTPFSLEIEIGQRISVANFFLYVSHYSRNSKRA